MFRKLLAVAIVATLFGTYPAPAFATGYQEHVEAAAKIAKRLLSSGKRMIGEHGGTHAHTGYYGRNGARHNSLWVVQRLGSTEVRSRFDLHPAGEPKKPDGVPRHATTYVYEPPTGDKTPANKAVLLEAIRRVNIPTR
jgi:hypothetical protein